MSSRQPVETRIPTPNTIPERYIVLVPVRPSSSLSHHQAMASPFDTREDEPSSPAEPERISIRELWPHSPDITPGPSPTSEGGLFETIAQFREDHQRAIGFEDDGMFWGCSPYSPPDSPASIVPQHFTTIEPIFEPMGPYMPYYPIMEKFDPNSWAHKQLNPMAKAFKYQSNPDTIQDTAPESGQQALQLDHPATELPAPETQAEAPVAPIPQPQTPRKEALRLRELPHHPSQIKKRRKAAEAQNQGLTNRNGATNYNRTGQSHRSQNGSSASKQSRGSYRPGRSHGFGSGGPSASGYSTVSSSPNEPPKSPRDQNNWRSGLGGNLSSTTPKTHTNSSISTVSASSTPPGTGSNSPGSLATAGTSPSISPTPSLSSTCKFKKTGGP